MKNHSISHIIDEEGNSIPIEEFLLKNPKYLTDNFPPPLSEERAEFQKQFLESINSNPQKYEIVSNGIRNIFIKFIYDTYYNTLIERLNDKENNHNELNFIKHLCKIFINKIKISIFDYPEFKDSLEQSVLKFEGLIDNIDFFLERLRHIPFYKQTNNKASELWFYVVLEYAKGEFTKYNEKELTASEISQKIQEKYNLSKDIPRNYISEIRYNSGNNKNYLKDSKKVLIVFSYCTENNIRMTSEFSSIWEQYL